MDDERHRLSKLHDSRCVYRNSTKGRFPAVYEFAELSRYCHVYSFHAAFT